MGRIDCPDFCRTHSIRDILDLRCKCKECIVSVKKQQKPKRRKKISKKPKCFKKVNTCPPRINQIALPTLRTAEYTLLRYSTVIQPERMINMCKLITQIRLPAKQTVNFLKMKQPQHKPNHIKSKKSNDKWLEDQTYKWANVFRHYLSDMSDYIPVYKQLLISAKLWCALEFRKVRCCNKYVKPELKKLCDKLAIMIDVKLKPYKQELHVEPVSVCTLEDKHVVFKMIKSITEIEYIEEEEETIVESMYEAYPEEIEEEEESIGLTQELEELISEIGREGKEGEEGEGEEEEEEGLYGESDGAGKRGDEGLEEETYLGYGEGEGSEVGKGKGEIGEAESEIFGVQAAEEEAEEVIGEESIQLGVGVEGEGESIIEEELEAKLRPASEEESVMEGIEEEYDHPPGSSSYVDWCLYVSWLKEFGYNIEMYASCLKKFRCVLLREDSGKHQAILKFLLTNWSKYLAESRQVDKEMTQYFKDKPITWCDKCRDCTIDDYPRQHYIPPELEHAINNTKEWRRLLAEADEYCKKLCPEEEAESESEVEEMYEIYNVLSSSSSSFDIETIPMDKPGKSGAKHGGKKKK